MIVLLLDIGGYNCTIAGIHSIEEDFGGKLALGRLVKPVPLLLR